MRWLAGTCVTIGGDEFVLEGLIEKLVAVLPEKDKELAVLVSTLENTLLLLGGGLRWIPPYRCKELSLERPQALEA